MSDAKQTIYVWECIFYTQNEKGRNTYYDAPKLDWSHISECVEMEDLVVRDPPNFFPAEEDQ